MHYDYNTGNTYWAQCGFGGGTLRLVDLETGKSTSIGVVDKLGVQMSSMYTIPGEEISVPETMEPVGIQVDERNTVVVGDTVALTARVLPLSISQMDETLTWTSSDETVATVENGVVTGVAAGTVTITATTANGFTDTCELVVTENQRRFYAYDEDNTQWISFTADDPGNVTVERKDAAGESPISATALVGDTLYSYDEDCRLYTIDPDTFERTLLNDSLYGTTYSYYLAGKTYELQRMPVDMSYDAATGTLYVDMIGYEDRVSDLGGAYKFGCISLVYKVDLETGETRLACLNDTLLMGNLMVENGRMFFVDAFLSGVFSYIDLSDWRWQRVELGQIVDYWGLFYWGRGMVRDDYTGTVYAIWDKSGVGGLDISGNSELVSLNINNPDATFYGRIGDGIVVNSLFIR